MRKVMTLILLIYCLFSNGYGQYVESSIENVNVEIFEMSFKAKKNNTEDLIFRKVIKYEDYYYIIRGVDGADPFHPNYVMEKFDENFKKVGTIELPSQKNSFIHAFEVVNEGLLIAYTDNVKNEWITNAQIFSFVQMKMLQKVEINRQPRISKYHILNVKAKAFDNGLILFKIIPEEIKKGETQSLYAIYSSELEIIEDATETFDSKLIDDWLDDAKQIIKNKNGTFWVIDHKKNNRTYMSNPSSHTNISSYYTIDSFEAYNLSMLDSLGDTLWVNAIVGYNNFGLNGKIVSISMYKDPILITDSTLNVVYNIQNRNLNLRSLEFSNLENLTVYPNGKIKREVIIDYKRKENKKAKYRLYQVINAKNGVQILPEVIGIADFRSKGYRMLRITLK